MGSLLIFYRSNTPEGLISRDLRVSNDLKDLNDFNSELSIMHYFTILSTALRMGSVLMPVPTACCIQ